MTNVPPVPEQILAAALHSYNTGRLAHAEQACQHLLELLPRHPAAHQLLATLALQREQLAQAHQHILLSLAPRPDHVPSLIVAGKIATAEGDATSAVAYFERAARHQPGMSQAHFHLGNSLAALGRHQEAILALRRAIALAPEAMEAVLNLGTALREQGELPAARDAFEQAVALRPDVAQAWFNLGLARQDLHDTDGAAAAFAQALHLQPDYADAALNLGVALQEARHLDEALHAYRTALRLQPQWYGRIAHALSAGSTGQIWLDTRQLQQALRG